MPGRMLTLACKERMGSGSNPASLLFFLRDSRKHTAEPEAQQNENFKNSTAGLAFSIMLYNIIRCNIRIRFLSNQGRQHHSYILAGFSPNLWEHSPQAIEVILGCVEQE